MVVDRERVRSLLAEGRSRSEVAQSTGCHPTTVWRIARETAAAQPTPRQRSAPPESEAPSRGVDVGLDRVREVRRETARLRAELELREAERTVQAYDRRAREEDDRAQAQAEREGEQRQEQERNRQEAIAASIQQQGQARVEQARRAIEMMVDELRNKTDRQQREAVQRSERFSRAEAAHSRLRLREQRLDGPAGSWWQCTRCGDEYLAEGVPSSCPRCTGSLLPRQ